MNSSNVYLRVGDYVTLRNVKIEGYLSADGILQSDVVLQDDTSRFDDCVFAIHLQRQYAACEELNEFMKTYDPKNVDPEDKHTQKYLNALKRGKDNENILNESYMKQKMGQPVLFGDIVQFYHVKSGKYVTIVPNKLAKDERENLMIQMDVDGSPYSWINISPRFKIDREGDQILSTTEVYLKVAERSNEYVHCSQHIPNIEGRSREINCSLESTSWRVNIFHESHVLADKNILTVSQLVTINDPEIKSYVAVSFPKVTSLDGDVDVFVGNNSLEEAKEAKEQQAQAAASSGKKSAAATMQLELAIDEGTGAGPGPASPMAATAASFGGAPAGDEDEEDEVQQIVIQPMGEVVDSNAIWTIESKNMLSGGAVYWKSDQVRLRHLNSGVYLKQVMLGGAEGDDAGAAGLNSSKKISPPTMATVRGGDSDSEGSDESESVCLYTTTDNRLDEGTLFSINEILNTRPELSNRKAVRIHNDGVWLCRGDVEETLDYNTSGSLNKLDAVSLIISRFVQREVGDDPDEETKEGEEEDEEEGEGDREKPKLASADDGGEAHYYESGHVEPLDVHVGVTAARYLQRYLRMIEIPLFDTVSTLWPTADRSDVEFFFRLMQRLNYFCRGFPISAEELQLDVDKANPIIKTRRQHQLREQRIVELVLRMISKLIPISVQTQAIANLLKFNKAVSEERLACNRMGQRILNYCFEFIYSAVLDHPDNQMYVADFMPVLLAHLSSQPLAGKCVTEMLSKNMELQETKIGSREIAIFVNQLKESRMNAMYLGLLQSCCSCEGDGVNNNQVKIANMLFSSISDAIIQLHADYAKLSSPPWATESIYTPAVAVPGAPVTGEILTSKGLPALSLTWTTQSIDYSPLGLFGKLSVPIEELYKPGGMASSGADNKKEGGKNSKILAKRSAALEQKKAVADYFVAEMYLGAELAVDGNYVAMQKLDPLFPYEVLVTMLLLKVDDSLKAAACRLLLCLHIERDPQAESVIPRLARTWTDISANVEPQLPYVEHGRRNKFGIMQRIISEHVKGMQNTRWSLLSKPMLHVYRMLVVFGFYGNKERMEDVIYPLLKAIDRRQLGASAVSKAARNSEDEGEVEEEKPMWQLTMLTFLGSVEILLFVLVLVGVAVGLTIYESIEPEAAKFVWMFWTQLVILVLFVVEAAARYYCTVVVYLSWTHFFKSYLNWIDVFVVLIDIAFYFVPSGGSAGAYAKVLRLLRLIRLVRILRAARVVTGIVEDLSAEQSVSSYTLPSRYLKAPTHELESMVEALDILAVAQSNIDDRNLSLLLRHFYEWQEAGCVKPPREVFAEVIAKTQELNLHTPDSDDIMIDITMYINPELTQSCLNLVMAQHSTRKSLLDNAENTQLLVSPKRERQVRLIDQMLRQLERNVETQELWGELQTESDYAQSKQTKDILSELIDICRMKRHTFHVSVSWVPDKEIQDLLRNLGLYGICMKVLNLLESVEEDENGEIGEVGENTTFLCRQASNLLYWFCLDNPQNQALAFDDLDSFIETLDAGISSEIVLTAVFQNNEKLMRLCARSTLEAMVDAICKDGRKFEFLSLFTAITHVGDKNVAENQYEIVKLISQPGRYEKIQLFMVPIDSEEYQEKVDLMEPFLGKSNVVLEDLPEELVYYMHFLDVLCACTVGRLNVSAVEAKIQAVFVLDDLLGGILDERCIPIVRRAMVQFYYDVIIDVEMAVPGLERNVNMWKLLLTFPDVLQETLAHIKIMDKEGLDSTKYDRGVVAYGITAAQVIAGFFTRYYEAVNFRAYLESQDGIRLKFLQVDKLVVDIYGPLNEIHRLKCPLLEMEDKLAVYDAAEALGRALQFCGHSIADRLISPLEEEQEQVVAKELTVEGAILNKYKEFLKEIMDDEEVQKEVAEENLGFIAKIEELPVLKNREVEADVRFEIFIKKLVSHTREKILTVDNERKLDAQCTATSIFFIKAFRSMIENRWGMTMQQRNVRGGAEEDARAQQVIVALNVCGTTTLCIDLLNVGIDEELQTEALKLGIALLLRDGGARKTQDTMFNYLAKTNSELFFKQARLSIQKLIEWSNWHGAVEVQPGDSVELPEAILMVRYLQLMCVGHVKQNQDLLREQANSTSYNLLDDMVQYLNCLSRIQCRTSTEAAQAVSSLILEVLQGPCSKNQEHFALNTELVETLNRIMRCKPIRDCVYEEELDLKRNCIDIFQAMLEGQSLTGVVYERVLSVIHLDVIQITYDSDILTEQQKAVKTESFVLLQMLCNCKPSLRDELGIEEDVIDDSLKSGTACLEIIWRGEIQRRYFHVPPICANLSKASKDELVLGIDRTNNEKKLTEFLFRCRELYKEVKHQQLLIDMNLSRIFSSTNYERATTLAFLLALGQNLLFLIYYSKQYATKTYTNEAARIIAILNIMQIITAFFTFVLFCVVRGPVKYQIYKEGGYSVIMTWFYTATDFMTLYYFGYFVVAILGMVHNDFWSSLLMMDIVMKNSTARDVLNAVYYPRKQLAMAFLLGIFILYIFSYVNFFYYQEDLHFEYKTGENDDHHFKQYCHTLFACFSVTSVYGLRQPGGNMDLMEPTLLTRFVVDMLYLIIVLVLAINIIFGIIIDTFGNLRSQKNSRLAETIGKCFICNIDREVFDRAADGPDGFKIHVKRDHNMWNYMYFIFLIWEQDREDDDGLELYIRQCIEKNELAWFPIRKALRLNQVSSEEDDLRNSMKEKVSSLEAKLKQRVNAFKLEFNTSIDQLTDVLRSEPAHATTKHGHSTRTLV